MFLQVFLSLKKVATSRKHPKSLRLKTPAKKIEGGGGELKAWRRVKGVGCVFFL